MTKNFLLEQLKRAEISSLDEIKFHEEYDQKSFWLHHEKGHLEIINLIRDWISHSEDVDVEKIKRLIRSRVKFNKDTIHQIEEKNNHWENEEDGFDSFNETDDGFLYYLSDGMNCESGTFLRILNKKYYYPKSVYIPTNWNEFVNIPYPEGIGACKSPCLE